MEARRRRGRDISDQISAIRRQGKRRLKSEKLKVKEFKKSQKITQRKRREEKGRKRRGAEVSGRKSPPFAQTAKDGAPSSTGDGRREETGRRERNSRRKDRAVRREEDEIQFVGDTCNRESGGKPPHSKVGRDETRLWVGVPRWGELRCGSERPHP
jgi:hypothetical protein